MREPIPECARRVNEHREIRDTSFSSLALGAEDVHSKFTPDSRREEGGADVGVERAGNRRATASLVITAARHARKGVLLGEGLGFIFLTKVW